MSSVIAIVTGANKGIGRAIVRNLAVEYSKSIYPQTTPKLVIYLTSRDVSRGMATLAEVTRELEDKKVLEAEGGPAEIRFGELDITDSTSVNNFKKTVQNVCGEVDILINNAALGTEFQGEPFSYEVVEKTLKTNYFGLKNMTELFFPIIKNPGGRIINLSSGLGRLAALPSKSLRNQFSSQDLTQEQLDRLVNKFQNDVRAGVYAEEGWPTSGMNKAPWTIAYNVSKLAVVAYTKLLARRLDKEGIMINTHVVDPGWVRSDMGGENAPLSVDQGAETPVYLALTQDKAIEINGQFWNKKKPIAW
ncbi:8351_t:CDS:2 [Paraglomus occultum]|uniref:8351_t:CDS:1 n=1 Tax=Paraglomus occultum TaxID=144539 RepID=A0A9N9D557_9GLOM|nr:8351_t:CDS:2 [Paraglomus occultum]